MFASIILPWLLSSAFHPPHSSCKNGPFLSHPFHRKGKLRHQGQQACQLGMVSQGAIQMGANEPPGSQFELLPPIHCDRARFPSAVAALEVMYFQFLKFFLLRVVLISAIQQSNSVICIYIFYTLFHYGLSQDIEYSFSVLYGRTLSFIHSTYKSYRFL